jgi:hypothetical protein
MKKLFLIITILISFAGCQQKPTEEQNVSSSTSNNVSPTNEPQPFKIVESTYKVESGFGSNFLKWAMILENPNLTSYGLFPAITITARDENGNIVGTEDQVLSEFPPGIKVAFASQLSLTKVPKTVDFTVSKVEWKNTATKPSDYIPFQVNKINFSLSGKNTATVSGDITNPYGKNIDQIAVTSLLRDDSGKLIGGSTTYVDALPANGSRPYSDKFVTVDGKPAKAEVFVMPWGIVSWNQIVSGK